MAKPDLAELLRQDPERGLRAAIGAYGTLAMKAVRAVGGSGVSNEDAEEIVSDVFIALWRARETLRGDRGSLAAYIFTAARRKTVDFLRKRGARPDACVPLEQLEDFPSAERVEAAAERRELRERLTDALLSLGEPDATILFRRFYLQETYAEIARRLGMSENAVNKRALRAQKKLSEKLKGA
jgi:RNA polymerase sigma-70 factor (ECF subfamily)